MPPTHTRPPQLLIASHNHGAGAELLQLAERRGYAVRRAHSGAQALEQAHAAPPDLVVLDESLTDMDAVAATRALRDDADVGPGTPLLLISAQRPSSPQHHAALRAGVWEFLRHPFNAEEIAAKLDTYVLLKLDGDRARRETSIADAEGFYTVRGLALRAQELTLQAFHHAQPLACVALAPVTTDGQNAVAVDLLADVLRSEEHTSELQSQSNLVCRLLLEKKKKKGDQTHTFNSRETHTEENVGDDKLNLCSSILTTP